MNEEIEKMEFDNPSENKSLRSIAISLKRIADKLELAQKQSIIMNAEEALKYHKAKEAYDAGVAAMRKSSTP